MDKLETLIWSLTGLVVLAIVGLIALPAFGIKPGKSDISFAEVEDEFKQRNQGSDPNEWRKNLRLPEYRGQTRSFGSTGGGARPAARPAARGGAGRSGESAGGGDAGAEDRGTDALGHTESPQPDPAPATDVASSNGPSIPEAPTVYLPPAMVEKYRHLEDGMEALQSAQSWDVDVDGTPAIQVGEMAQNSPLRRFLGLQPGDIVISVNGKPVSRANGRALFEEMRGETFFRVEVLREGTRFFMTYEVR